jgi:16S rRNA processing protein RimM
MVGQRQRRIAARRGTPEHPIVVLEGVTDRSAAEALRGEPIAVPREALGALAEGEYLVDDLVGCEVVDGDTVVGRVRDVLLLPSADALEVERPDADPLLVPLVGDAVRSVDVAARRVDVDARFLA